ncbi:hypothetical protein DdX_22290 [Ditylenchus destructor]|uniref:Uncharacterized protein n=1 Tax=Ditylenchus destructor TaxID=166010 RepID=A0AAD4MHS8_9BILA|nr:hypothetical protein DdX_22290 [Ditylenchus destructor]
MAGVPRLPCGSGVACDALVLSGRAPALRHAYGRAIVKSAHGGAVSAACHLHTVNELKGRLKMLAKHDRKSRTRITAGVTGAAVLTLAGLALTASAPRRRRTCAPMSATRSASICRIRLPARGSGSARGTGRSCRPGGRSEGGQEDPHRHARQGRQNHHHRRQRHQHRHTAQAVVIKDGKVVNGDELLADMTVVSSANCGAPKDGEVKIESKDGKHRKIVICMDRIEARSEAARARGMAARDAALARADASREAALARAEASRDAAIARGMASRDAALARAEASREAGEAARAIAMESRTIALASADLGKRHAMLGPQDGAQVDRNANPPEPVAESRCAQGNR